MQEDLKKYPLTFEVNVQWGDMDSFQHVNNLIYLRWTESARIYYFEKLEMDVGGPSNQSVGPILGWQDCKYIFPMTYPDTAIIGVRTYELLDDRFMMECAVFSKKHQRIAALAKQSVIPYDYKNLKKAKLPPIWIDKIHAIDNRTFSR